MSEEWRWENLTEREELKRWHCSRFNELKNVVHVSTQIIDKNLFFRFFIIVHADKGFVTRGGAFNSRLLSFLFTLFTVTMAVSTLLPMTTSFLVEPNYPANTLQGKVIYNIYMSEWIANAVQCQITKIVMTWGSQSSEMFTKGHHRICLNLSKMS